MSVKMMTGASDEVAVITKQHRPPTMFNCEFFEEFHATAVCSAVCVIYYS